MVEIKECWKWLTQKRVCNARLRVSGFGNSTRLIFDLSSSPTPSLREIRKITRKAYKRCKCMFTKV